MPFVEITWDETDFDLERISKSIRKQIHVRWKEGVEIFIQQAQQVVPVLSGMAKGAFIQIAAVVGLAEDIDMTPNSPYADRLPIIGQSPELGAGLTSVIFIAKETFDELIFEVIANIPHYDRWEVETSSTGLGGWESFEIGEEAMTAYLESQVIN